MRRGVSQFVNRGLNTSRTLFNTTARSSSPTFVGARNRRGSWGVYVAVLGPAVAMIGLGSGIIAPVSAKERAKDWTEYEPKKSPDTPASGYFRTPVSGASGAWGGEEGPADGTVSVRDGERINLLYEYIDEDMQDLLEAGVTQLPHAEGVRVLAPTCRQTANVFLKDWIEAAGAEELAKKHGRSYVTFAHNLGGHHWCGLVLEYPQKMATAFVTRSSDVQAYQRDLKAVFSALPEGWQTRIIPGYKQTGLDCGPLSIETLLSYLGDGKHDFSQKAQPSGWKMRQRHLSWLTDDQRKRHLARQFGEREW